MAKKFQSAISRYLVSNFLVLELQGPSYGFNPLYRGTWFPTFTKGTDWKAEKKFQSAISRYLVSNLPQKRPL